MKIVLFANTDWYLYNFRLPLAESLRERGDEVILIAPAGAYGQTLRSRGFTLHDFCLSRKEMNPLVELRTITRLMALYRMLQPGLVHHFTIKCVLYGGIAARRLGIPSVSAVTGMGYVFTARAMKFAILRPPIFSAYRFALKRSHVIFQNPDDREAFLSRGLVSIDRAHLIRGSGVDVTRFAQSSKPMQNVYSAKLNIIFVGRLLREKGVSEFVEAARSVRSLHPEAQFHIAGEPDAGNPSTISPIQIHRWTDEGCVQFLGQCSNMPDLLRVSDICVLPSYYGEGVPRSLVEAAATGLPIVTTDMPGCREICREGENGILVPPRDAGALAAAIIRLIENPAMRKKMGVQSRKIAVSEFSEVKVIAETIKVYAFATEASPQALTSRRAR